MDHSRLLAATSAAQLGTGLAGLALALKRRHPYHVGPMRGRPGTVGRDSLTMGTALSAPAYMLAAQTIATRRLWRTPSPGAERLLGWLGLSMTGGYLGESLVRRRLRPSQLDALESPLLVVAITLSVAMAVLGLARSRDERTTDA